MNLFPSFVVDKRKFYAKNSTHLLVVLPNPSGIRVNSSSLPILLIGLCVGITLGVALIPLFESDCQTTFSTPHNIIPQSNVVLKRFQAQNNASLTTKILRPRFYSTELGLRKKLLAGILLTDSTRLENLVAINKTLSSFVNQLLFFVLGPETSQQVRKLGLGPVVTLSSKRNDSISGQLSELQISQLGLRAIKYLAQKCSDDFDFFYLTLDLYYTNGLVLQKVVNQVSVSADVFWGAEGCPLETGLVFSRSILRKLSSKLDRCLTSKVLKQGSDPLRSCYAFSFGSQDQCSGTLETHKYLTTSSKGSSMFSSSMSIGRVQDAKEMYWIHLMNSEERAQEIDKRITNVAEEMNRTQSQVHEGYQISSWPAGISTPYRPQNRFDVLNWKFFTQSNLYPQNEHVPQTSLTGGIEALDISLVINNSAEYLTKIHDQNPDTLCFQYGYTRFDETRGSEYLLTFLNANGTTLRVQSLRPLSKVEIVPMPFVTETRRVTIVIPLISLDLFNQTDSFIKNYLNSAEKVSNSVLVFAIILPDSRILSPVQSASLQKLKRLISKHNSDFSSVQGNNSDIKVGHVIVDLKQFKASHHIFAVFDMLSNHILSPNSLVLVMDLFLGEISQEFLNRVRMNTILNYQVFSPIPFVEYDPKVYGRDESKDFEINKSTGYFDGDSFNFLSFYVGDYTVRKQSSNLSRSSIGTGVGGVRHLSQFFLAESNEKSSSSPHFLRGPEPTLILRFDNSLYQNCSQDFKCLQRNWGSKAQLAKLIFNSTPHPPANGFL